MKSFLLPLLSIAALISAQAQDAPKPAAPATPAPAAPATPAPAAPAGEVTKIMLGVLPAVMKFDKATLEVKAGAKVMILFKNEKCPLQHNFLLTNPGKLADMGALADKMLTDPQAMAKHYTPESPEILAHSSKLIGIGQSDLIAFTAPAAPGDYPYLCTFPGHWRMMNGVLKVTP
jgi:azurin